LANVNAIRSVAAKSRWDHLRRTARSTADPRGKTLTGFRPDSTGYIAAVNEKGDWIMHDMQRMPERIIGKSSGAVRELTVAETDIVSGARLGQPFPDPIPNPSPTFPPV